MSAEGNKMKYYERLNYNIYAGNACIRLGLTAEQLNAGLLDRLVEAAADVVEAWEFDEVGQLDESYIESVRAELKKLKGGE